MNNLHLEPILNSDFVLRKRISKKIDEIEEDISNLKQTAEEYFLKYHKEVIDGTQLKLKLLSEGRSNGLSESQIMSQHGTFIPTIHTPILNLLHFMFQETSESDSDKYKNRDLIDELLLKYKQLDHKETGNEVEDNEFLSKFISKELENIRKETLPDKMREQINKKFYTETKETIESKTTPEIMEFLYGNISIDTFNKIKKLKALSKSPNEQESYQAYKKAKELCQEYNLDFDRIPCYVD